MRDASIPYDRPRVFRLRATVVAAAAASVGAVGLYIAAIVFSGPLLGVAPTSDNADVLVVLGGDGPARAMRAAELWHEHAAPKVLVTGDGDCLYIAADMVRAGVPQGAISTECASGSTWENAEFSAPILARMQARNAILVTSWFHGRRALASFNAFAPGIDFSVASTPQPPLWPVASTLVGQMVAEEYPKTVLYGLRLWIRNIFGTGPA